MIILMKDLKVNTFYCSGVALYFVYHVKVIGNDIEAKWDSLIGNFWTSDLATLNKDTVFTYGDIWTGAPGQPKMPLVAPPNYPQGISYPPLQATNPALQVGLTPLPPPTPVTVVCVRDAKVGTYYYDKQYQTFFFISKNIDLGNDRFSFSYDCYSNTFNQKWTHYDMTHRGDDKLGEVWTGQPPLPSKAPSDNGNLPVMEKKAEEKPKAKSKEVKVIPENKNSKVCIKCYGINKEVVLFRFSTYYCPTCEG